MNAKQRNKHPANPYSRTPRLKQSRHTQHRTSSLQKTKRSPTHNRQEYHTTWNTELFSGTRTTMQPNTSQHHMEHWTSLEREPRRITNKMIQPESALFWTLAESKKKKLIQQESWNDPNNGPTECTKWLNSLHQIFLEGSIMARQNFYKTAATLP